MKYDTYCFEGRDIQSLLTPLCTHLQTLALVFLLTLLSSISASSCEQNTFLSIELRENNCRWRFYLLTTKTCLWTTYKKTWDKLCFKFTENFCESMPFIFFDFKSAKLREKLSFRSKTSITISKAMNRLYLCYKYKTDIEII